MTDKTSEITTQHSTPEDAKVVTDSKTESKAESKNEGKTEGEMESKKADSKKTMSKSSASKKPLLLLTIGLVLFIIVLLACLVGVAYFGWQYGQEQSARVTKVESQLDEQSAWFSTVMEQQSIHLNKQSNSLSALSQALEKDQEVIRQRLDAQANRLAQLSGENRDGWVLEEARYLLRLANQRQLTGGGAQGIIGLLESVDKLLITLDTPDVFPLRDTIQKNILTLKLAPIVDREGIYLHLAAFIARVDQLPPVPLQSSLKKSDTTNEEGTTLVESSHWQDGIWESIQHVFGKLDQYVRVQQHNQPLNVLLSDVQQQIVVQNLRLMLEQAQIALLREEGLIYEESLEQAIRWLHKHFSHFPEKQVFVDVLTELKQQNIVSQLPDISSSLKQLNLYMQSSHQAFEATRAKSSHPVKQKALKQKLLKKEPSKTIENKTPDPSSNDTSPSEPVMRR